MDAKWKWLIAAMCLACAGCGKPPAQQFPPEDCANGVDDDKNGFQDCADTACAAEAVCNPKQVQCTKQVDCMGGKTYAYFTRGIAPSDGGMANLNPLPMCVGQQCVIAEGQVQLRMDIQTNTYIGLNINSVNTRLVKKTAADGSAVSCQTLEEVAGGATPAPDAIEATNRFNLQAWDSRSTSQTVPGGTTISMTIDTNTGGDFIIWVELWSQRVEPNTRLPQGKRYGWACIESGAQVEPIKPEDHDLRQLKVSMPGPQFP